MNPGIILPSGYAPAIRCRAAVAPRRLVAALTISTLFHLLLAVSLPVETRLRVAGPLAAEPIVVRLEAWRDTEQEARVLEPRDTEAPFPAKTPGSPAAQPTRAPAPPLEEPTREIRPAQTAEPDRALPLVRDATYYDARELDAYPRPLAPLDFAYPERAARESMGGRLLARLLIDEYGAVRDVSVVEAEPAGYFEEGTLSVLGTARFHPALKDGRAVRSRIVIAVRFDAANATTATNGR